MEKSYLITLKDADLQTLVFSAVDRAIKLNKSSEPFPKSNNQKLTLSAKKIDEKVGLGTEKKVRI